jgi:hypothetical protein
MFMNISSSFPNKQSLGRNSDYLQISQDVNPVIDSIITA